MPGDDFRDLYQDVLLDHSRERHGHSLRPNPSAESHQRNRSCGDDITLRVHAVNGVVDSLSWTGQGCAISQASASMLCDITGGLTIQECGERVSAFRAMLQSRGKDGGDSDVLGDAVALSGVALYPPRVNCAMLAWVALEDALSQFGNTTESSDSPPKTDSDEVG